MFVYRSWLTLGNKLVDISSKILELSNLTLLNIGYNQLAQLNAKISSLKLLKTLDLRGNKISAHVKRVRASGDRSNISYAAAYDGKAYPAVGTRVGDTITLTSVDSHTVRSIVRKGSTVTSIARWVVSNDGKHLTVTRKSGSPAGKLITSTLFYDRKGASGPRR